MKIINDTYLSYAELGLIIDHILKKNIADTHYVGKEEVIFVDFGSKTIKIELRYLKRYTEWRFKEC